MTRADPTPDFDDLEQALSGLGALCSASELQGLLLGLIAAGRSPGEEEWLRLAGSHGDFQPPADAARQTLLGLRKDALAITRDEDLGLRLLLPDDDCDLGERVDQLACWCQGFLAGFAEARTAPGAEAEALLQDLVAIANAGLAEDEHDEAAESDFSDISEHVRLIAAQLCWEQRPADTPQAEPAATSPGDLFRRKTLH